MADKEKFACMEHILHCINSKIDRPDAELVQKSNNLDYIVTVIINKMKRKDALFKTLHLLPPRRPQTGQPVKILLSFPKYAPPALLTTSASLVQVKLQNYHGCMGQPAAMSVFGRFGTLFDAEKFLNPENVCNWIEKILRDVLTEPIRTETGTFEVAIKRKGSAFELKTSGTKIDLVPCFVIGGDRWPRRFRLNPVKNKPEFLIVPKLAHSWELSFEGQEGELMKGKGTLKRAVKLLKKLKDHLGHGCISDYCIKNVALSLVEGDTEEFWNGPVSHSFMCLLKEYKSLIERGTIPYYWNQKVNLIGGVDVAVLKDIASSLQNVINDIEDDRNGAPGWHNTCVGDSK